MLASSKARGGVEALEYAIFMSLIGIVLFAAAAAIYFERGKRPTKVEVTGPWEPDATEAVTITVVSVAKVGPEKVLVSSVDGAIFVLEIRTFQRQYQGGNEGRSELTAALLKLKPNERARLVVLRAPRDDGSRTVLSVMTVRQ